MVLVYLLQNDASYGTVVGGVPAKFICTTEEYAKKCKINMPKAGFKILFKKNEEKNY